MLELFFSVTALCRLSIIKGSQIAKSTVNTSRIEMQGKFPTIDLYHLDGRGF